MMFQSAVYFNIWFGDLTHGMLRSKLKITFLSVIQFGIKLGINIISLQFKLGRETTIQNSSTNYYTLYARSSYVMPCERQLELKIQQCVNIINCQISGHRSIDQVYYSHNWDGCLYITEFVFRKGTMICKSLNNLALSFMEKLFRRTTSFQN